MDKDLREKWGLTSANSINLGRLFAPKCLLCLC